MGNKPYCIVHTRRFTFSIQICFNMVIWTWYDIKGMADKIIIIKKTMSIIVGTKLHTSSHQWPMCSWSTCLLFETAQKHAHTRAWWSQKFAFEEIEFMFIAKTSWRWASSKSDGTPEWNPTMQSKQGKTYFSAAIRHPTRVCWTRKIKKKTLQFRENIETLDRLRGKCRENWQNIIYI